jgi:hypothetical protein
MPPIKRRQYATQHHYSARDAIHDWRRSMSALPPLPAPYRATLSDGQTAAFRLVDACHAAINVHTVASHAHLLDRQDDELAANLRHEAQSALIDLWKALDACNISPRDLARVLSRGGVA